MLRIIKKYKYLITIIIVIIIVIISFILKDNLKQEEYVFENDLIVATKEVEIKTNTIKVEIKGAVTNPGLYELEVNSRVKDLIDLSGGLLTNANTSLINLARILEDEMVVIVYTNEEVDNSNKVVVVEKIIEKECVCEIVTNDACLTDDDQSDNLLININTATLEELLTLAGIGESKAKDIITYREENNGFNTIEDIMNVSGIGESTFNSIKEFITT